jgi:hypothetical protein
MRQKTVLKQQKESVAGKQELVKEKSKVYAKEEMIGTKNQAV